MTTAYSYNSFGELKTDSATYSSNAYLSHEYTYDKVGRILTRTETILGNRDQYAYTYDSAGRLTDVSKNNGVVAHYEYDANGNRLSRSALGVSETATYDDQDRMLTYGDLSYTYTANGELKSTTNTKTGQVTQYSYDVLGNVLKVVLPNGKVIEYVVDGQDRRIAKKVNGQLVSGFLYEGDLSPVAQLDNQNRIVSRFVYATRVNVPDYIEKGGKTYRVVTDHLGSVRLVVDVNDGTIAQKIEYDEFGRVLSDSHVGFQPFGFAGGLYETETGLVRFGARDYDATTGRWTTKDPIGFGGGDTNLYGYVVGDPVNATDFLGLKKGDKDYGYSDDFWNWYHQNWKYKGDDDASKGETQEAYEEWVNQGKPKVKDKPYNKYNKMCDINSHSSPGYPWQLPQNYQPVNPWWVLPTVVIIIIILSPVGA